jgi:hypothetical protein
MAVPGNQTALEEQREFIQMYQEQVLGGKALSREEQEEMESVLYSVSFGKQEHTKKGTY